MNKELTRELNNDTSIRRKRTVMKMVANGGKQIGKTMEAEGYSKAYAHNPQKFLNAKKTKELLGWIDYELEQIASRMEKTRNKAKYKELSDTFVNLKKLNQLLGGQATERIVITPEDKKEIDDAFENV